MGPKECIKKLSFYNFDVMVMRVIMNYGQHGVFRPLFPPTPRQELVTDRSTLS